MAAAHSHTLLYQVTFKSYNSAKIPTAAYKIGRCIFSKEKQVYQIHVKKEFTLVFLSYEFKKNNL